jgi:two-component system OmpR family sensor kinase/two-component system sensor histidine kinase BaeS
MRARFFRRLAVAAAVFMLLAITGLISLASMLTTRAGVTGPVAPAALVTAGLVAAAFMVVVFGGMRRFARPLGALMDAADRVAVGDYQVRVDEHGPPPIRALAHSFNTMTERLHGADRQRRDLLADVAHELRTPLTVIQGRLEGMRDGVYPRDDDQVAQALEDIRLLARLIEDLRTLSHAESGTLTLTREPTDIARLLTEAAASMRAQADARRVAIAVHAAALPAIDIDPVRIREAITNLLSNAVRYSPAGGTVLLSADAGANGITIRVRDHGPGIPADDLPRIFDRFHKGPMSAGSGLGLTIARNLVSAHGGTIDAESQPGEGTIMTVTLRT